MAREYFHRFGPAWYQGGLFWLDADVTGEEIEPRFHSILRAIKPETPDLKALRDSGKNARDELAAALQQLPQEAGVLFVVDDVPEPVPGDPPKLLEEWCPGAAVVTILSTSRTTAGSRGANVHPLNLDVLPLVAAVDLLTYRNQRAALGDAQWHSIAEWIGRLPLALELLQRAMQAGAISPRELFDLANENRGTTHELDRLMAALNGEVPAGALRGITEAFDKSYDLLSESAREAARLLACLAPEPIPLAVLKAMGDEPSSGAVRAALISRSFITRPEVLGGAAQLFEIFGQMHKLLADFVRAKSPAGPADLRRAANALLDVMDTASCRNPAKWPLMNASLRHAELVFERLLQSAEKQDAHFAVETGSRIGLLHAAQGAAEKARKVEDQTLELALKRLGPEDARTLNAMSNLATTFSAGGDLEGARKLQEEVLEVHTRILGGEHRYTLTAMSNLAVTLTDLGDLERASKLHEEALDVRTRTLGPDHTDTLIAMNNLAATLSARGDLEGARKLLKSVLDAFTRILGSDHPDTLKSMNNLAWTLHAQGDLEGARKLHEQVLNALTRILGVEHPDTLTAMSNLAAALSDQGELENASRLNEQALDARARVLGREHLSTTASAWNLFSTLLNQGKTERAITILDQNLKWLLERPPETLSHQQRQIRESLEKLFREPQ